MVTAFLRWLWLLVSWEVRWLWLLVSWEVRGAYTRGKAERKANMRLRTPPDTYGVEATKTRIKERWMAIYHGEALAERAERTRALRTERRRVRREAIAARKRMRVA